MAKLGAYYALCPLIDTKHLLGISEDAENSILIVTLGKNISSRYKISDQKQLSCWRTKEKFSSPVIYDKSSSKYVAVFNYSFIKIWNEDENLDKVKKYKFNKQIYTIISNGENTFIVFNNGSIHMLQDALEQRKSLITESVGINNIADVIYKKIHDQFYVGIVSTTDQKYDLHWTIISENRKTKFYKINLYKEDCFLRGYVFHSEKNSGTFLTLWSDGSIYSYNLGNFENSIGELFAVVESISTKYSVSIVSLYEHYIAMYGANYNEEGALLLIYNTQFKITQCKQPFKLFTDGAKLWYNENNLIVPVGQNLAVIPFRLETEQIAALVGSHITPQDAEVKITNDLEVALWDSKYTIRERDVPEKLKPKISDCVYQGLPESITIEEVLPEIFEKSDIRMLFLVLIYFSDIPEKYLAKVLKFSLALDKSYFAGKKYDLPGLSETLQPTERINLIDNILRKPFSDILLIPHLRAELSLNDVISLLSYICLLFSEDGCVLPSMNFVETEAKLIEWSCVLLDSSYQKLVLSTDEPVQDLLKRMHILISDHLKCLVELQALNPILELFKRQKVVNRDTKLNNLRYSVEQISLS